MPNADDLKESMSELISTQRELISTLKTKKDTWNKFRSISIFISSVIIGGIGAIFTLVYNNHESRIRELESHEKFISHLEKKSTRPIAIEALNSLGNRDFALRVMRHYKHSESGDTTEGAYEDVIDGIMSTPDPKEQGKVPRPRRSTIEDKLNLDTGWIYLGEFSGDIWKTRYLDFNMTDKPRLLIGKIISVGGMANALHVREGMPTNDGHFKQIEYTLERGSKIRIKDIREWWNTGYIWAEVEYSKK